MILCSVNLLLPAGIFALLSLASSLYLVWLYFRQQTESKYNEQDSQRSEQDEMTGLLEPTENSDQPVSSTRRAIADVFCVTKTKERKNDKLGKS